MSTIENTFLLAAHEQCAHYNRVAEFKEQEAAWEVLAAKLAHERAEIDKQTAELNKRQVENWLRPSVVLRPDLSYDGDEFVARHGACVASGPTPELAYQAFDRAWIGDTDD